jgi:hypothetical protein
LRGCNSGENSISRADDSMPTIATDSKIGKFLLSKLHRQKQGVQK